MQEIKIIKRRSDLLRKSFPDIATIVEIDEPIDDFFALNWVLDYFLGWRWANDKTTSWAVIFYWHRQLSWNWATTFGIAEKEFNTSLEKNMKEPKITNRPVSELTEDERLHELLSCVWKIRELGYDAPYIKDGVLYLLKRGTHVRNSDGLYHNLEGPALQWGTKAYYCIKNVEFSKEDFDRLKNSNWHMSEILKTRNMEQRRVLMEMKTPEEIVSQLELKPLDSYREFELFSTKIEETAVNIAKYECVTGRVYYDFVPPEITNAREARARKWNLPADLYDRVMTHG